MTNQLWENIFKRDQQFHGEYKVLEKCPLFKGLSKREFKLLINSVHVRKYQSGELVFRQEEVGVGMYIIAEGRVEIFIENELGSVSSDDDNKRNLVTRLKKGDFFGELALVEEQSRRTATAQTSTEATLIGLFQPDLIELAERSPSTGVKILFQLGEILGRRLKETSIKISELKKQLDKIKSTK